MRIGCQTDQRRSAFLVPLGRLDDGNLRTTGRVHHGADVAEPLRPRRIELAADEVAHVHTGGGLALSAVAEIETASGKRHAAAPLSLLRKDERRPRSSFYDDRSRRSPVPRDAVHAESLE